MSKKALALALALQRALGKAKDLGNKQAKSAFSSSSVSVHFVKDTLTFKRGDANGQEPSLPNARSRPNRAFVADLSCN